ncbi:unnamed protein product [Absidia cylindrospora]
MATTTVATATTTATATTANHRRSNNKTATSPTTGFIKLESGGGLAAKVKELCQQEKQQLHGQQEPPSSSPLPMDLDVRPSTSYKRKRTDRDPSITLALSAGPSLSPHPSASTPLSGTSQHHRLHHSTSISSPPLPYLSPQLPPLQQQPLSPIATSLNSLSSSLQQQLHLSSGTSPKYYPHHHHTASPPPSTSSSSSYNLRPYQLHNTSSSTIPLSSSVQYPAALGIPPSPPTPSIQIETVSLKSMPSDEPCFYFIRNLAITDTFTFRHLLDETDIIGTTPPPSGKRIIITDPSSERIFPLSQAIRSVVPRPSSSHMEFCLGLADKTSIDWSSYA